MFGWVLLEGSMQNIERRWTGDDVRESLRRISGGQSTWGHHRNGEYEIKNFMKLKIFMIFNFFELGFFIALRAPRLSVREPLGRVFGRQSTRGHHTNVQWQFGEVLQMNFVK